MDDINLLKVETSSCFRMKSLLYDMLHRMFEYVICFEHYGNFLCVLNAGKVNCNFLNKLKYHFL